MFLALAMFDLGESRCVLEDERAKYEDRLPCVDCVDTWMLSETCLAGVNGEASLEALVARLAVRFRGDGVRGSRPPAVLEENKP